MSKEFIKVDRADFLRDQEELKRLREEKHAITRGIDDPRDGIRLTRAGAATVVLATNRVLVAAKALTKAQRASGPKRDRPTALVEAYHKAHEELFAAVDHLDQVTK